MDSSTNDSPRVVFSLLMVALASMGLLFGASVSQTTLAVAQDSVAHVVVRPVMGMFDNLGEAGYATAVNIGAIPAERSIYAVVDFPVNHRSLLSGQVAGASTQVTDYAVSYSQEAYITPWAGLYKLFE